MQSIQTLSINDAIKSRSLHFWASLLFIALSTFAAYWFLGGQNYLANHAEIDYRLFHHPEDDSDILAWIALFFYNGSIGAWLGLHVALFVLALWKLKSQLGNSIGYLIDLIFLS